MSEEGSKTDDWNKIPKLVRKKIFGYLDPVSKLNLSLCSRRTWNNIVERPDFFHRIVFSHFEKPGDEYYTIKMFYEDKKESEEDEESDSDDEYSDEEPDYSVLFDTFPLRRCSFFDDDSDSDEDDSSSDENETGKKEEKEKEEILDEEEKRQKELLKRRGEIPLTRAYIKGELAKHNPREKFSLFESAKFTLFEGYYPEVAWNHFKTFLEKRQKSVGVIEIKNVRKMFNIDKIKVKKFARLERLNICESYMFKFFLKRLPDNIKNVKLSGGLTGIVQNLSGIVDSYPKMLNVSDSLSMKIVNISYDGFLRLNARKIEVPMDTIKYEDVNNFIKLWVDGKISKTKFDMCRFNQHSKFKMDEILKDLDYVEIGDHVRRERYDHFPMKKRQMYRIVHKIEPKNFIDVIKFKNILILCVNSDVNDGYENNKHICNVNFCCQESYQELLNHEGPTWATYGL